MAVLRWIFRLIIWLTLEWISGVTGILLIIAGLLPPDADGMAVMQFFQNIIGVDLARYGFIVMGFLLIFIAVYSNFFSYTSLKSSLREAVDDFGSENINVRLLAIEEILAVSRKSRRLHPQAMRVLANFVRMQSPVQPFRGRSVTVVRTRFGRPTASCEQNRQSEMHEYAQSESNVARRETPIDVRTAVEAISQRRRFFDDPRHWIDLSETDLPSISLEKRIIGQVSFAGSYLRHARFDGADLRNSGFDCAILTDATFSNADLRNASFFGCMGHRLHLDKSDLRGASFFGADLYDASIQTADARKASFFNCNLWRLDGGLTNFSDCEFINADLTGASLQHAKGITKEQIVGEHGFGAIIDRTTRLPWSTDYELQNAGVYKAKVS